jgi:hypothetical protein
MQKDLGFAIDSTQLIQDVTLGSNVYYRSGQFVQSYNSKKFIHPFNCQVLYDHDFCHTIITLAWVWRPLRGIPID